MSWIIDTPEHVLRLPKVHDVDALYQLLSDLVMASFTPRTAMVTITQAVDEIRRMQLKLDAKEAVYWMIEHKESGEVRGRIGFNGANWIHARAQLVCEISPHNSALLGDIAQPFCQYLFQQFHLHRLEALILNNDELNQDASSIKKLAHTLNMKYEGDLPNHIEFNEKWIHYQLYSLIET
jgi:RimJ/RimL family protein N-acetyltransferase